MAANPAVPVLSVLCLALGIGADTAIFTFVNALLLRPVPLAATDRLMIVQEVRRQDRRSPGPVSHPNFVDWKRDGGAVGEMAAQRPVSARITGDGEPQRYTGALVSANFFSLLGVPVAVGRGFFENEDRPGGTPVVLLSHALWQERFAWSAPAGDVWFSVVGVSDDILTWDLSNRPVATAYVPYAFVPVNEPTLCLRTSGDPMLLARPARAAVVAADPILPILQVSTMTEVHHAAPWLVLGATGVYGVVSSFVSQRTRDMGIRAALGADRRRLIGHVVRQGLSATLVGVALGLGGAAAVARLLRAQLHDVSATDPVSFAGVATLLVVTGLLASYVPARRAAAVDPLTAIRD
jgi:putative ABC transport system permease protein